MQNLSPQAPAPPPDAPKSGAPTLQSTVLFKGQKTVLIEHNGAFYRLQTTKLGKLILTK